MVRRGEEEFLTCRQIESYDLRLRIGLSSIPGMAIPAESFVDLLTVWLELIQISLTGRGFMLRVLGLRGLTHHGMGTFEL
jgi:hypothetical protein